MIVPPGSVVVQDWHKSQEAKCYYGTILQRNKRKTFGLLERPVLPPQAVAAIASYKIFVSGKSAVGKTALVASLAGLQGPSAHHETTGIQTTAVYWPARLQESGNPIFFKFTFWDCGESVLKKFDHLLPACTEGVDGFLLLFSFTDQASFNDLPSLISRATPGAAKAVKIIVGTKFDQFAHSDITEHDLDTFRHTWGLPVLRAKRLSPSGSCAGLSGVAPILNGLAEHLWRQDQWAAGLLPPPCL